MGSRAVAMAAVMCAVMCAVAIAVAGCGALKQVGAGSHTAPAKTLTFSARLTTLVIDGGTSITVTGSSRGTVLVSQQSSYTKTAPVTAHRIAGTTLTLSYTCPGELVCGVTYNVQVPRGMAVQASSHAGAITLTSLAGAVTAQTDAGLITATDLRSLTAQLRSNAGGIVASFSAPPVSVRASTRLGPISIIVPGSVAYRIDTHTYVGASNVTVRKSAASAHVITASSDLGSITIGPA